MEVKNKSHKKNDAILTNVGVQVKKFNKNDLEITNVRTTPQGKQIRTTIKLYKFVPRKARGRTVVVPMICRDYAFKNYNVTNGTYVFNKNLMNKIRVKRETSIIELDENQNVAYRYLLENYLTLDRVQKGNATCIFQMDAGTGKSFVASKLLCSYPLKALIIAPKVGIIEGWKRLFEKWVPGVKVSTNLKDKHHDILLLTAKAAYTKVASLTDYQFVIMDEIHSLATPQYSKIFWLYAPIVLGLTATPDHRLDVFDKVYREHLGDVVYAKDIPGYDIGAKSFEGAVKCLSVRTRLSKTDIYANLINELCEDPRRLQAVADEIIDLYERGHNVFVFADRRNYLRDLMNGIFDGARDWELKDGESFRILSPSGLIPCEDVFLIVGGAPEKELQDARDSARVIFTTYECSKEGVSYDRMDSMVLATPRKHKMEQILGRILRRNGDDSVVRQIIDIKDTSRMFTNQFRERRKMYKKMKYNIEYVEYSG